MNRPDWWPSNPYPKNVFTMTTAEYVEAIPNPKLRTRISGFLGCHFWQLADKAFFEALEERIEDLGTELKQWRDMERLDV